MLLGYIWIAFFTVAFILGIVRTFLLPDTHSLYNINAIPEMVVALFNSSKGAFDLALGLTGMLTLWLGLLKIAEKAGLIEKLSAFIAPFFSKLFPEVPKGHPVLGSILMNLSANMLGLADAATPLGLKAMEGLQELNPKKDTASNAQIMFLVLNTAGLTIVPINILMFRSQLGSASPSDVFIPILITTFVATLVGMLVVGIRQKINFFDRTLLLFLVGSSFFIAVLISFFMQLAPSMIKLYSELSGNIILFSIIILFLWVGLLKKLSVFEVFIEGAKEGFHVAIRIIPYLVGLLSAITLFKASGAFDLIIMGVKNLSNENSRIVEIAQALPTALMKPLSGSGARALMIDSMKQYGPDSFTGRLSCIFQGSVDTTFYIVAVYFGSVGVKNSRYAISCGLLADLASVIAAIIIAILFFPA
jgi:spore maturation protein SpmA